MAFPNIFTAPAAEAVIERINRLTPETPAQWGKMSVDQVLAHCNVTYEMLFEDIHPKPGFLMGWMLRTFVKNGVVNDVPYKKNGQTAPAFIIKSDKDFSKEKERLIAYIRRVQQMGGAAFEKRVSHSFGPLSQTEWNNLFYKHLDHHLTQFGV